MPIYQRLLELSELADEIVRVSEGSDFLDGTLFIRINLENSQAIRGCVAMLQESERIELEEINTLKELVLCLGELKEEEEALHYSRKAVKLAPMITNMGEFGK